ncbi:MAG: ABC transporter permease [Gemmatimonadales bacterium]
MLEALWRDLRLAGRSLSRSPVFVLAAGLVIAIGIGATTTVLSVGNRLLSEPPTGVREAGRLVTVHSLSKDGSSFHAFSLPDYRDLREGQRAVASLAAYTTVPVSIAGEGDPELVAGLSVSSNYFATVGARAARGRFFTADEERPGTEAVVVLSHQYWARRFAAEPSMVGRRVLLNGKPATVVGIGEPGFRGHLAGLDVSAWVSLGTDAALRGAERFAARNHDWLELVGRLGDDVDPREARSALDAVGARLAPERGEAGALETDVRPYTPVPPMVATPVGGFLAVLLLLAALILLIACVNVGSILLSRATTRRREIAVRLALGSGRGPVVRQLLVESMLVYLLGAAGGIALAVVATRLLGGLRPPGGVPVALVVGVDPVVLGLTLGIALLAGLGFGVGPAWRATAIAPASVLRVGQTGGGGQRRMRHRFVVAQVAGSVLLLAMAGLFVRGAARAGEVDLGMDPAGVHVLEVDFSLAGRPTAEATRLAAEAERLIAELPGVRSVGRIDLLPLSLANQTSGFLVPGREAVEGVGAFGTDFAVVSPSYFETIGIALVAGRGFAESDVAGGPPVVVVNEAIARTLWPGESAVGKTLLYGSFRPERATPVEVVGVVRDSKYRSIGEEPRFMLFQTSAQEPRGATAFLIRHAAPDVVRAARDVIRRLDPGLPFTSDWSYQQVIGLSLLPTRIAATLASAFGAVGLLLAMVGLYGAVAFAVGVRLKEYGVRMALGASRSDVRREVLRDGLRPTAIGLAIGGVAAVGAGQLIRGFLFGLSPLDPVAFGAIALLLGGAAVVACLVPSRRASRTDPMEVLRHE